ncbi:hypothetical protein BDF19DRAFT_425172 [Syncephalis fuscata]|nr:hypothetical protein BDF19DRAFT_425172 [Syncephalis fuscata]
MYAHSVFMRWSIWLYLFRATLLVIAAQFAVHALATPFGSLNLSIEESKQLPWSNKIADVAYTVDNAILPRPLSGIAQKIYSAMINVEKTELKNSSIPLNQILSAGKIVRHSIDYAENNNLCAEMFAKPIEEAQEEVVLSTFLIEQDSKCLLNISRSLRKLNAKAQKEGRRVRVYMITDALALVVATDVDLGYLISLFKNTGNKSVAKALLRKLELVPNLLNGVHELPTRLVGLPDPAELPAIDFRLRTFHFWPAGTLHSKTMTIDGRKVIVGSRNIDSASGLELLVDIEGPVALAARNDFFHIWRTARPTSDGESEYGMNRHSSENSAVPMPLLHQPMPITTPDMVPILVAPHNWESRVELHKVMDLQNVAWIVAMNSAKQNVFIQTPNFNVPDIRQIVADTVRRGVKVDLVTSYHFEDVGEALYPDSQADGTNHIALKQLYNTVGLNNFKPPTNFQACWFVGRQQPPKTEPDKNNWSHVKFMNVDNEIALFGSGNQDAQSWFHSQEFNLVIDDANFTRSITKELLQKQQSFTPCHTNA